LGLSSLIDNELTFVDPNDKTFRKLLPRFNVSPRSEIAKFLLNCFNTVSRIISKKRLNYDPYLSSSLNYYIDLVELIDIKKSYLLTGFWQHSRFLTDNLDYMREILLFKENRMLHEKKINYNSSLIIHIRGKDFLVNKSHNVLAFDYFEKAVNIIKEEAHITDYYVVTDDIEYSKKNLYFLSDYNIISSLESSDSYINDFQALSKFKFAVISNSTFSLWARMLSENNILTVMPRYFYKSTSNFQYFEINSKFKTL
jgi:hypothetical protein